MRGLALHVFWSKYVCLGLVFTAFSHLASGQASSATNKSILDDSTKSIYGPKTSLWTTEKDLFQNRANYRAIDSSVSNYHRWTYVQRFNYFYKDLGIVGTALSPIFPILPTSAGASAGFQVYEPYYATEEPRYFDTKSPFTRMHIIWGGNGRAMTRVEFSRNISPRWNFGFNYRPILVDRQILRKKGVRQTVSHYYDFYTTYKSKDERYLLLFNFRRIRHRVNEEGGVVHKESDPYSKYFDPNARTNLVAARTEEYRRVVHVFQQYQLIKPLQIYFTVDFTKQTNGFTDDYSSGKDPKTYFDHNEVDSTKANDQTTFITSQQEGGLKGNLSKLFYNVYYKTRSFNYSNPYLKGIELPVQTSGIENYAGGNFSLLLDSLSEISGSAEYLIGGFYRVEGQVQTPRFEGYFKNSLSKPGFMQMIYRGSHDYWNHSFAGISSTQAQGFLKFSNRRVELKAGGTFTALSNYVYFREVTPPDTINNQRVLPYQSAGIQSIFSPEIKLSVRFLRHVYFRPQVIYTDIFKNDDDALQIPLWFYNGQLSYENLLFKSHLQLQAGVDFHWQSTYNALGYDPAIQQYFVTRQYYMKQTLTVSPAYPMVDVFFTGKMKRARFFFKYHNLTQLVTKIGYMSTPGYPGQRNLIDFGFDFLLFD